MRADLGCGHPTARRRVQGERRRRERGNKRDEEENAAHKNAALSAKRLHLEEDEAEGGAMGV